jgi:hypothetical protein
MGAAWAGRSVPSTNHQPIVPAPKSCSLHKMLQCTSAEDAPGMLFQAVMRNYSMPTRHEEICNGTGRGYAGWANSQRETHDASLACRTGVLQLQQVYTNA